MNVISQLQNALRRFAPRFVLPGCLFLCALPTGLYAQSVQFTGAQRTLGSGFSSPFAVALDKNGNVYVADTSSSAVYEMLAVGGVIPVSPTIRTLGSGFSSPSGVAVDGSGNVYVADTSNNAVKEILAVSGVIPASPTIRTLGSGFISPGGVAVDGSGNVFVADTSNNAVKELLTVDGSIPASPTIRTLGSGFDEPDGVAVDGSGNVYVSDGVLSGAVEEMLAVGGSIPASPTINTLGSFEFPSGLTVDGSGNVYVAEPLNDMVQEILAVGGSIPASPTIQTVGAGFYHPRAVAVDGRGNIFVADSGNQAIYEIQVAGSYLGTLNVGSAGASVPLQFTFSAATAGIATAALTQGAVGLDFADAGTGTCTTNGASYSYSAGDTCTVNLRFTPRYPGLRLGALQIVTAMGGNVLTTVPIYGIGTGPQAGFVSEAGIALHADLGQTAGVAVDGAGNLFVSDGANERVVEILASGEEFTLLTETPPPGQITMDGAGDLFVVDFLGGDVMELPADGGSASELNSLVLENPNGIAFDGQGNLFIADWGEDALFEVPANGGTQILFNPDVCDATGVAVDAAGDVFTADQCHGTLIKMPAGGGTPVVVATGFEGPTGIAADAAGDVFVTDESSTLYEIPAGGGAKIVLNSSGLSGPQQVAVDAAGDLFVADSNNDRVVELPYSRPPSLAFPNQTVGTAGYSQSVTLANTGNAALSISSIGLTGADASSFVFANNCGTSLAPGANCSIHGHFAPAASGALTAAVTIHDNAANSPQTILLSGTGIAAPAAKLSATSLSFGSVKVGTASASQVVTLTNTGDAALSITSIEVTGADASSFVFANTCGTSLAAGANCTIHGHFAPAAAGALTAAVTITDSATGSPQSIALSGTGVASAAVKLSATSLSFGSVKVGEASSSQMVTLTNTGDEPLSITSIEVTGADASSFVFANSCGTSVAAGASCSIHGHFAPATTGALTAAVSIVDNAGGSPQTIALSGAGQ